MATSLREFLAHVIASGLLDSRLTKLADRGATTEELASAPGLPPELQDLLMWRNGLNLDVVRIHGVGAAAFRVEKVHRHDAGEGIAFASDPAGFEYLLAPDGSVVVSDHDGGDGSVVAAGVDDFLRGYVFGPRAGEFGGNRWADEVAEVLGKA